MPRHNSPASTAFEQPSPPAEPSDVDIIAYERVSVKPNDDIHSVAEAAPGMALESAHYGAAGEKITYGNLAGQELLEEKHDLKERMKRLEDKQANSEREIANHKTQISYLQDRVKALALGSEGYRKIRHRFLEVYRRDVRDDLDRQGHQKIGKGNEAAYEGDAVADAGLYTSNERFDEGVLIDLYGLTATQISYFFRAGDFLSISVLNTAVTWKVKGPNKNPPDVAAAFKTFIKELKLNHDRSLTDGTNPLSKAYFAFWTAHNEHKRLHQMVA